MKRSLKPIGKSLMTTWSVMGFIWTVLEMADQIFVTSTTVDAMRQNAYVLIVPAFFAGLVRLIIQIHKEFFMHYCIGEKRINVCFGDILKKKDGDIIVGVNKDLKTDINEVAKGSIHYQLLEKDSSDEVKKIFENFKKINKGEHFFQGSVGGRNYIFLIMSSLNSNGIANTSKKYVEESIRELFYHQERIIADNNMIWIPLIGTGAAGNNFSKGDTLVEIVKIYLKFCADKRADKCDKIHSLNIVVSRKDAKFINWTSVQAKLELLINECSTCEDFM